MTTRGTTLVELIVSIVILAIMAGITTLAIHGARSSASVEDTSIRQARMKAIRQGAAVKLVVLGEGTATPVTLLFLPDGRALGAQSGDSTTEGR